MSSAGKVSRNVRKSARDAGAFERTLRSVSSSTSGEITSSMSPRMQSRSKSRADPWADMAAAIKTVESTKTLPIGDFGVDAILLLDEYGALLSPRLDEIFKSQTLLAEGCSEPIQGSRGDDF